MELGQKANDDDGGEGEGSEQWQVRDDGLSLENKASGREAEVVREVARAQHETTEKRERERERERERV
jgi:hypothetical protein